MNCTPAYWVSAFYTISLFSFPSPLTYFITISTVGKIHFCQKNPTKPDIIFLSKINFSFIKCQERKLNPGIIAERVALISHKT